MLLIENKENSENSAHHMINATIANRGESAETVNTVTTRGVKTADWQGTTIERMNNDDGDGKENGKKAERFRLAKQQLCTCITLFCTLLCRRCTTTTWKCVISRFVEEHETTNFFSETIRCIGLKFSEMTETVTPFQYSEFIFYQRHQIVISVC